MHERHHQYIITPTNPPIINIKIRVKIPCQVTIMVMLLEWTVVAIFDNQNRTDHCCMRSFHFSTYWRLEQWPKIFFVPSSYFVTPISQAPTTLDLFFDRTIPC
jgi:hypothetical protein